MPLQNRVTPEGDIVATAARGSMLGNRGGCFHRDDRTLRRRQFASRQWICCLLAFKARRRTPMSPGLYTELFFLDEATALSAGHRPCFECRRAEAERFAVLWNEARGLAGRAAAPDMDKILHGERLDDAGRKKTFRANLGDLPAGVFVRQRSGPHLWTGTTLKPWSFAGYGKPVTPDAAAADVLTPRSIVAVLAAGYTPALA